MRATATFVESKLLAWQVAVRAASHSSSPAPALDLALALEAWPESSSGCAQHLGLQDWCGARAA